MKVVALAEANGIELLRHFDAPTNSFIFLFTKDGQNMSISVDRNATEMDAPFVDTVLCNHVMNFFGIGR